MKTPIHMFLLLRCLVAGRKDLAFLSELPLSELLAQKRMLEGGNAREGAPVAMALEEARGEAMKKTFYEEDYEDGKGHPSKKHEHKMEDLLNTSIMALSYLAFGGYLLCMLASALREKRRRYAMMGYPTIGPTVGNQFAQVLQHHANRPSRPFNRFPTVTVHQGGRRRRRRSPTV